MPTLHHRRLLPMAALLALPATLPAQAPADGSDTADPTLRKIQNNLEWQVALEMHHSLLVGVTDGSERTFLVAGPMGDARARPSPQTLYRLGSVGKTFTALLALRGPLSLEAPVTDYLPGETEVRTLRDQPPPSVGSLALHTAGFPRLPPDFDHARPDTGYPHWNERKLLEYIASDAYAVRHYAHQTAPEGFRFEYSDLGYGLLGLLVERAAGEPYAKLLREEVTRPLGLEDTYARVPPQLRERLAPAHVGVDPAPPFVEPGLPGIGTGVSSGADLLSFVEAAMLARETPLAKTFREMMRPREATPNDNTYAGYGWQISTSIDGTSVIVWQSGMAGGHAVFVGFNPLEQRGVVVLSSTARPLEGIGFHALAPEHFGLPEPGPFVEVNTARLEGYTGTYEVRPGMEVEITREEKKLYAKLTGQPRERIYARSEDTFITADGPLRLRFERIEANRAGEVVLSTPQERFRARREDG